MIFTNPTEYAIRGLAELVCRSNPTNGRMMIEELVKGTDLPKDFMAKIFQKLAKAGVLVSTKAAAGIFAGEACRIDHHHAGLRSIGGTSLYRSLRRRSGAVQ